MAKNPPPFYLIKRAKFSRDISVRNLVDNNSPHYMKLVSLELIEQMSVPGTVGEMIENFERSNVDVRERTILNRKQVSNMITQFFGEDRSVKSIRPKDADELWTYMANKYALGTYQRNIKTVKQIFDVAVRLKWLEDNPFKHIKGGNAVNTSRQYLVSKKETEMVLEACPNAYWRLIFSLGRFGGLRIPSELVHMKWSDIFWDQGKLRIWVPKKTRKNESLDSRYTPLFKPLRKALEDYLYSLPEGCPDLIFPGINGDTNLRRRMTQIILRAGLTPWPKLFQNLRSTRETELLRRCPLHLVCKWIGNTPTVAIKHYAQTMEEDYLLWSDFDMEDAVKRSGRHPNGDIFFDDYEAFIPHETEG